MKAVRDWSLFAFVHCVLMAENLFAPNGPLGDVLFTYPQWIAQGMVGGGWQGLNADGVYPMLALVPMFFGAFGWGWWFVFVFAINALAFGFARSHGRIAALAWLGFLALLGPIAVGRIDVLTVALGVVVIALTDSNPRVAGVLIAVATWVKVWPVILGLSALLTTRARVITVWAVGTAVAVGVAGVSIGGFANVTSFLGDQQGRGIQVEAVAATPWLWDALGGGFSAVVFSSELLTFEIQGTSTAEVAAMLTLFELIVLLALATRIVLHRVRMSGEITTHILGLSLTTLIAALIVFNKVGSPQFVSWLGVAVIALVLYWQQRWSPILLTLIAVIAGLTHVIYPYFYFDLLSLAPVPVVLITVRNVAEVALFATATIALLGELRLEELANEGRDGRIVNEKSVMTER